MRMDHKVMVMDVRNACLAVQFLDGPCDAAMLCIDGMCL